MKILAIDDTKTLLSLLSMTLRNAGHEVAEAENGEEGLNKFDAFQPDLVITDLNMPIMDGIEFTRACRARPAGQNTPIIVLTTENGAEIKAEGRRAGASAWMVKPFEPNTLLVFEVELLEIAGKAGTAPDPVAPKIADVHDHGAGG